MVVGPDGAAVGRSGEKLTLSDIARLAGVGAATASRALNGAPGVAAATRDRVRRIAEEHQYVISPAASALAAGSTRRIALVVPHLSRWFFATLAEAVHSVVTPAGFDVLLYTVGDLADRHRFFEQLPARRNVDALVLLGLPIAERERQRLELMGVHIVAVGGQHTTFPHVCIDDLATGRIAVQHLVSLGHRAVATIEAIDPDQEDPPLDRARAYRQVLEEAGVEPDPRLRVVTTWGVDEASQAMADLLSLPRRPTAVYAHSDEVALGAARTIRRAGLRIPQDVSVVGIDDHPLADLTDLTTVRQPVWEQGVRAGELTLELLRDGSAREPSVVLPTRLVVRGSTAPPP